MSLNDMRNFVMERMSYEIQDDRILLIPDRDDQFGYVDTEGSTVWLITIQEARLVPTSNQESRLDDA